jgi:hypothetical protein
MTEENLTWEERKREWLEISMIDEAQFDADRKLQGERQSEVPQPGDMAPDFELDLLDRGRKRTGDIVRLATLRGKPVALMFGSYT